MQKFKALSLLLVILFSFSSFVTNFYEMDEIYPFFKTINYHTISDSDALKSLFDLIREYRELVVE